MICNKILVPTFSIIVLFVCCDLDREKTYSEEIVFKENFETNNICKIVLKLTPCFPFKLTPHFHVIKSA